MGERWFGQEYECEFSEVTAGVFDMGVVDRAMSKDFGKIEF